MGYTFTDHTADVAVDLTGRTLEELFDPARHPSRVMVKGATYHGLTVTGAARRLAGGRGSCWIFENVQTGGPGDQERSFLRRTPELLNLL